MNKTRMLFSIGAALHIFTAAMIADEVRGTVTFQIRDQSGQVRSVQSAALPAEAAGLTMTEFLKASATDSCERLKASACRVSEVYRRNPSDDSVHQIVHCNPGDACKVMVDALQPGDIVIFVRGGYCCGF